MYAFDFQRPSSLGDAAKLAANSNAKLLAGGQTLLASMKLRLANPEQLVDLGAIAELAGIKRDGNAIVIGAMTKHADVASGADVKSAIPALADLAGGIGDRQVRAMGTIGGSLANNDPAACYPAAVLALGATVNTNKRKIAADDFFQGLFTTALEEGEVITSVSFPIARKAAYIKFKQPASRFALIGVFVAQTDSGVRVAVTGGGNGVFRHTGLEQALTKSFDPQAAAGVKVDSSGLSADLHASAAYRANLVGVLTQRAVAKALG
ncbi:xanthine dehydrogenase family protein subunit M [Ramlibacter sp. G-1-2-2]|uniref:Xanthine dehydrogenase family protein subunit M n=1 Tax=Ramlibacter agri TaxID=2728837 RepID=A0A848HDI3_9BURK|nr:xanthine dehydrogenase family protein subunit M [Ramlibacter agri]NML46603.1 xanthine dehydrogenase family protein subunit M [Ramlibacter agri]